RSIHHMGHIKMMAAAQPFLSGAISKTVNMPEHCTVEEIFDAYLQSWKLGVKAVAIYRDNSKRTQPLSTATDAQKADKKEVGDAIAAKKANRRKLPDERQSITHKFSIAGQEGYFMVGLYEDGSPGELFIKMSKEGSTISGLMDSFAVSISMCLQYGVPLRVLVNKFSHTRFEPSGYTTNREIPIAKSLMDYIFRWFDLKFHPNGDNGHFGKELPAQPTLTEEVEPKKASEPASAAVVEKAPVQAKAAATKAPALSLFPTYENGHANGAANGNLADAQASLMQSQADSPPCPNCGAITVRSGACYKCNECGTTTGCG
ncbi:vitamin B12-dependent ribonucleotide reductase, partial [bacterium]